MNFFNWEEFQSLAKAMFEMKNKNEVMLRSAINRSYFAAFNISEYYAKKHCDFKKKDCLNFSIHQGVINSLIKNVDREVRRAGSDLGKLKNNRVKADYHAGAKINPKEMGVSIILADNIIAALKETIPEDKIVK